tara:strand:- start:436 stop:717 length:282 start_codon:yes stop_codon:yes gene_type:complete
MNELYNKYYKKDNAINQKLNEYHTSNNDILNCKYSNNLNYNLENVNKQSRSLDMSYYHTYTVNNNCIIDPFNSIDFPKGGISTRKLYHTCINK